MVRLKEALMHPGHDRDNIVYVFFRILNIPAEKLTPEEISVMAKELTHPENRHEYARQSEQMTLTGKQGGVA